MPPTVAAAAAAAPAPPLPTPFRPLRAPPSRRAAVKLPRVVRRTYLKFRAYFVVHSVGSVAFTVVLRACVCELPHTHNTHTQQQQQNFIHGKQK